MTDTAGHLPFNAAKGRSRDAGAEAEIAALLGAAAPRRDLLIEYLHLVQDRFGHLAARHLHALARAMRLSQSEIFEVASFYHHFDIVKEGEAAPAPRTLRICCSDRAPSSRPPRRTWPPTRASPAISKSSLRVAIAILIANLM